LEKALDDDWNYMLGTVTGQVFLFRSAELHGDWIHLSPVQSVPDAGSRFENMKVLQSAMKIKERGTDVRLDATAWVIEATS
jgi:hypothetical protein